MKKILLSVFTVVSFVAFGQADLDVRLKSPAAGANVSSGMSFNIEVVVRNTGTVAVSAMDTILWLPSVNGQPFQNGQGAPVVFTDQVAIAAGDSATLPARSVSVTGSTSGQLTVCAAAFALGLVESDSLNNFACNAINFTGGGTMSTADYAVNLISDNSFFSNGVFHAEISNVNLSQDQAKLQVFNIIGTEVFNANLQSGSEGISQDVTLPNGLQRGVYVVQISTSSETLAVQKILVD